MVLPQRLITIQVTGSTALAGGLGLGLGYLGAKLTPVVSGWLGRNGTVIAEEAQITQFGDRVVAPAVTTPKVPVQFGNGTNQVSHAFRHVEEAGLSRSAVHRQ